VKNKTVLLAVLTGETQSDHLAINLNRLYGQKYG
jgi:hypothetical protein